MKPVVTFFVLFLFIAGSATAQLILGGQASLLNNEGNNQWGGGVQVKGLIGDRLAIGGIIRSYPKNLQSETGTIGGESVTITSGNAITPVAGMIEYYFGKKADFNPYIGTDAGLYFNRNFTIVNSDEVDVVNQDTKKTYFGIAPKAGFMIKTGGLFAIFAQAQYNFLFGSGDPEEITVPGFGGASIETKPADKFWTFDAGILLRLKPAGK
jgi:outer membrane protein W